MTFTFKFSFLLRSSVLTKDYPIKDRIDNVDSVDNFTNFQRFFIGCGFEFIDVYGKKLSIKGIVFNHKNIHSYNS